MEALLQRRLTERITPTRVFSVFRGEDGVGKPNVVANLAAALTVVGNASRLLTVTWSSQTLA